MKPSSERRTINPTLHEALIRLIPIQAQSIREKALARAQPPPATTPSQLAASKPTVDEDEDADDDENEEKEEERRKIYEKIYEKDFETRALACERKLLELLGQCGTRRSARVNACLEVVKAVCVDCTPFAHVLVDIFRELELALYATSEDPQSNATVPYFELVNSLEKAVAKEEEAGQKWSSSLLDYESHIERLEQNMESLSEHVRKAGFLNKNLHASIEVVTASLEAAQGKVGTCKSQLKELQQELKDSNAEVRRLRSTEVQLEHAANLAKQVKLKAEYGQLVNELKHFQTFLDAARNQMAACVPRPEYLEIKDKMLQLQNKVSELEAKTVKLTFETAHLTPRPVWEQAPGTDQTLSTLVQVAEICKQNAVLTNKLSKLQTEWTNTNVQLAEVNEKYEAQKAAAAAGAKKK